MSIKKPVSWEPWEFENDRLRKSLPEDLVSEKFKNTNDEECAAYLLTLAMIFNDFKGLVQVNDSMSHLYRTPAATELTSHAGEKQGISLQMLKLVLATLHEALVYIQETTEIHNSEYIQRRLRGTSHSSQLVWEILNKVASGDPIEDVRFEEYGELRDFLVKARNNVGFHYQTRKQLIAGYRKFFFEGISNIPSEMREWAYRSTKKGRFDLSRYYYSDAALQAYYINLFGDEKLAQQRIDETFKLISLVVYAIHDLLISHHETLPSR